MDVRSSTSGYRSDILLATATAVTTGAWFSAWLAGLYVDPGNWPIRYVLFGVGFLAVVVLVFLWMRHLARERHDAVCYLDVLSRLDPRDLAEGVNQADLPKLTEDNPWHAPIQRLAAAFSENCRKAQQADHARAALEVRLGRLRTEKEQIQEILDSLSEPVLAVDAFDDLVLANRSAASVFHLDLGSVEQRAVQNLVRCEQLVEILTDTRRRKTPTQRYGEIEVAGENGQAQCYSVTALNISVGSQAAADDGRSRGAVAVLRDISGYKAAQKRNAEFVSAVSHEMKTPLAGIKAYVELLADGDAEDDQTREEFLSVINAQTDRLQRLIDNLLNLARIEAGVVHVSKQARALNEMLEEAYHVVCPSAAAKNIEMVEDLSPMYLGVLADRDMILQAAINLLSNAVKYTPEGGKITLRSRLQDNEVLFEVEDTGVGLSAEDCEKVFEKFYRVKKDRKMAQGTGLGLPLAKHIVENVHGGRMTVESEEGVGSTFRVMLPCASQLT